MKSTQTVHLLQAVWKADLSFWWNPHCWFFSLQTAPVTQVHKIFRATGLLLLFSSVVKDWLIQMQRKSLRKRRKSSEDDVGRSDLPLHCQPRVATGDLCILIYALSVRLRSSSCCSRSREGAAVSRADGRAVLMPATLRREERAGKERLPQQGPLTAKTDSGWQEQKLSSYMSFSSIGMEQKWKNRSRKKS